jgi:hypothetical protein
MNQGSDVGRGSRPGVWGWWLGAALTGAAVAIDLVDGAPLKLATSVLLFVGCLVAALTSVRRSRVATGIVAGCLVGAVVLIVVRLVGPGL